MSTPTNNVLPFPTLSCGHDRAPNAATTQTTTYVPVRTATIGIARPLLDPAQQAERVASVVRASIGFARRKGVKLQSLPPQLRGWLIALCNEGDPTCLVVHEWLTGNRRLRGIADDTVPSPGAATEREGA